MSDTERHHETLYALATASRGKVLLELGVKDGASTQSLYDAAWSNQGTLWSVDKNPTTFVPSGSVLDGGTWKFVQQDTIEFLKAWPRETKIDFVFMDDWHAYRHVRQELELLDPLVGPSSLILIHDTMHGHTEPFYNVDLTLTEGQWAEGGPYRAVAELNPQFWEFATIPWGHGLTILRKKYSKDFHHR